MTESNYMIFLTGFMGSGKSTIGPKLAKKLGYNFIDMDGVIEKVEGRSIREIFRVNGEEYFRRLESETLMNLSKNETRAVVALGGGALTDESNRLTVRKDGTLVYLKVSPEVILRRVGRSRARPMLLDSEGNMLVEARLHERIESLLKSRETYYLEADIVVDTSKSTVSESVAEIVAKLKGLIK